MAKVKIADLSTISGAVASGDLLPFVDVSDTTDSAEGTTKKVTSANLLGAGINATVGSLVVNSTLGVTGAATFVNLTTTGTTTLGDSGDATTVNGTLGVTGNLTVDTNTLFVDAANDRVGIGTTAPLAVLDVRGANQATGGAYNTYGNLFVATTDAYGANIGGSISLGGSGNGAANTNLYTFARIQGKKTNASAGDPGGYIAFETNDSAPGNLVERMRILSGGNVGIGTVAPNFDLEIEKTTVGGVVDFMLENLDNTNSASGVRNLAYVGGSSAGDPRFVLGVTGIKEWSMGIDNSDSDKFMIGEDSAVGSTTRLTIAVGGNVGIGTASPAHKLDVVGTAGLSTGTAWTNTSDKRIKKNITSIVNGLEKINQLNPVEFNYIQEYLDEHKELKDIRYNSFIADEYAEVFPNAINVGGNLEKIITKAVAEVKNEEGEIITEKIDEVKEIIHEKLLQYTPHDLIMYLVASVKELSAKVTALEAK